MANRRRNASLLRALVVLAGCACILSQPGTGTTAAKAPAAGAGEVRRRIPTAYRPPPPPAPLAKPACKTAWDEFDNQLISNFIPYDMLAVLWSGKPMTVFVPNGIAFQKLVTTLRAQNDMTKAQKDLLVGNLLRYHIIPGESITPTTLGWGSISEKTMGKPICSPGDSLTVLAADPVTVKVANTAQGEASKIYTGILSAIDMCEGVTAYILNDVMLPCDVRLMLPGMAPPPPDRSNCLRKALAQVQATKFSNLLQCTGFMQMLTTKQASMNFTLFVPTDDAFQAANYAYDCVNTEKTVLQNRLAYYIVANATRLGMLATSSNNNGFATQTYRSLKSPDSECPNNKLTVTFNGDGAGGLVDSGNQWQANVASNFMDLPACGATLYMNVMDNVLLPCCSNTQAALVTTLAAPAPDPWINKIRNLFVRVAQETATQFAVVLLPNDTAIQQFKKYMDDSAATLSDKQLYQVVQYHFLAGTVPVQVEKLINQVGGKIVSNTLMAGNTSSDMCTSDSNFNGQLVFTAQNANNQNAMKGGVLQPGAFVVTGTGNQRTAVEGQTVMCNGRVYSVDRMLLPCSVAGLVVTGSTPGASFAPPPMIANTTDQYGSGGVIDTNSSAQNSLTMLQFGNGAVTQSVWTWFSALLAMLCVGLMF